MHSSPQASQIELRLKGRSHERERFLKILLETIEKEDPQLCIDDWKWEKGFESFNDPEHLEQLKQFMDVSKAQFSKHVSISFRQKNNSTTPGNRWPHILCSAGHTAGDARYLIRDATNRLGNNLLDHNSFEDKKAQPIPKEEWVLLLKILTVAEPKLVKVESHLPVRKKIRS